MTGSGTIYYDDVRVLDLSVSSGALFTQKFTGKERDSESGLDNFGARYDSSQYGRFMTPDPGNAGADPYNPAELEHVQLCVKQSPKQH